jgi:hypothetical protein
MKTKAIKYFKSILNLLFCVLLLNSTSCFFDSKAPANLTAIPISSEQIDLAWNNNLNEQLKKALQKSQAKTKPVLTIEKSLNNENFASIAELPYETIQYSDKGLEANSIYYYRVKAYFKDKESIYSNIASVTTNIKNNFSTIPVTTLPSGFEDKEVSITKSNLQN